MALKLYKCLSRVSTVKQLRCVMTCSYNLEKVQEDLEKNPYYEKYASKIEALKLKNPEEFESRLKEVEDKKRPKKENKSVKPLNLTKPKSLSEIMKLDLLEGKKANEISQIWYEFHKGKDCVANVINSDIFNIISSRSLKFPTFIHPVPKDKGYEFYVSHFENNTAHFTPLRKFKELKENSPECLELHYYTELMDRNIVLIRGSYDKDEMTNLEANCLSSSFQLYYSELDGKRAKLLESFNHNPDNFQHMDLIAEFEANSKPKEYQ